MNKASLHEKINKFNSAKHQFKLDIEKNLGVLAEDIFKEFPCIDGVAVTGTTPSFNDGDPCYHTLNCSVGQSLITIADKSFDLYDLKTIISKEDPSIDILDENLFDFLKLGNLAEKENLFEDFSSSLNSIKALLNQLYGTNFKLTFKKDGTVEKTDSYSIY